MKTAVHIGAVVAAVVLLASCTENLDPLSPGSMNGEYALGMKSLMPLSVGNSWTYNATVFDTAGVQRSQFTYTVSVKDTVTADSSKIPLSSAARKSLTRGALVWYLLQGEAGATTCWQVDSVENLRVRKADDTRFLEQSAFNFRASIGDVTPLRYIGKDTVIWASGDRFVYNADSVKSALISKGADTLRTTLGSAPYFQYRETYALRAEYTDYFFKPGFGLCLIERFQRTPGGKMVRIRRDELATYYFK
jgi:hypothetical protein